MNQEKLHPEDAKLSALLREVRIESPLPARFQEGVWKRIEQSEASVTSKSNSTWLEALAGYLLRPRFALAAAIAMVLVGSAFGVHDGNLMARHETQARYLAAVAPNSLR